LILGESVKLARIAPSTVSVEEYAYTCSLPQVFSRGALQQTFRLLRKSNPTLALKVQNIMNQVAVPKPDEFAGDPRTDNFEVNLDGEDLQAILEALVAMADLNKLRTLSGNVTELGNLVIVKALIQDWIEVARYYMQRQMELHNPSSAVGH